MTLSELADYLGDIEKSIVVIRESDIESELEELDTNLEVAIEALESGPIVDKLKEMQTAVKALVAGFAEMNNVNLEEVAE